MLAVAAGFEVLPRAAASSKGSSRSGSSGSCSRRRSRSQRRTACRASRGAAGLSASLFASAPDSGDAESSFAKLHGLYWLAANFALRNPTLLVVDDLHWADEPSLRWLIYLAHRIEGLPLLLLVGTRPAAQANAPALVAELLGESASSRSIPAASGRRRSPALARGRLGGRAGPRLHRRAAFGIGWQSALPRCAPRRVVAGGDRADGRRSRRACSSSARRRSRAASRPASPDYRPTRPRCCAPQPCSEIEPSCLSPRRSPTSSRASR